MIELICTIEISPSIYSMQSISFPNKSGDEAPSQWFDYWKRCLSGSNLEHLEPITKGSFLVDITTISDKDLAIILEKEMEDVDLSQDDEIGILEGGIVIKQNDKIIIEPSCCGDLSNLEEYKSAIASTSNSWKELWIGHPWLYTRINGAILEVSDYSEYKSNQADELLPKYFLKIHDLQKELNKTESLIKNLQQQIVGYLNKKGITNADEKTIIMVSGYQN